MYCSGINHIIVNTKKINKIRIVHNLKLKIMKKLIGLVLVLFITSAPSLVAQSKYFTREGKVQFFSKAPLEDIEAVNRKATAVLDAETGQMEFSVLMKAFQFEKALMQEHFNENYVESNKYPKAVFKGTIDNIKEVKFTSDGSYPVTVSGTMDLHGVTNKMNAKGTIFVKAGKVSGLSEFDLAVKDYNIAIPGVVKDKVAEVVKVTIEVNYEPLEKK